MKIVHIDSYFDDGYGYQINILPSYHAKAGNDVVVVTSNVFNQQNSKENKNALGTHKLEDYIVNRIPIKFNFNQRFVVFKDLKSTLDLEKPDYIFCHAGATSPYLKAVSLYKNENPNTFIAIDNHADLNISGRNFIWKKFYYNFMWKNYISKYDKFIDIYFGVTPIRCLFLEEELGVSPEKIRLLPIGCQEIGSDEMFPREEIRETYGINPSDFVIIHGGKMSSLKEVDKIIKAFERIDRQDLKLVLFGKLEDQNLLPLIEKDKRIICLGWLDRKNTLSLLNASDVGIWNKHHTTLMEDCIAVRLPMILRYYGSTCHLIKNSGIYLYEGSIREIQDKIMFLIENREILEKYKKSAHELSNLLSYSRISQESIDYMKSTSPKNIHNLFMSNYYSDFQYKYFRTLK